MASFTDTFPDTAILNILGDDLDHYPPGGGMSTIKCEFEFKYLEEELGDQIDIIYPIAEINNADAATVTKRSRFAHSGVTYKLIKKRPIAAGKTQLILRVA